MRRAIPTASLAAFLVVAGPAVASAASAGAPGVLAERLPSRPFACPVSGEESRPDTVLRGRPAVVVFFAADDGEPSGLERFVGRMQEQFAPWLHWGAVLPGGAEDHAKTLRRLTGEGPLRAEHCWSDPAGEWRASLRLDALPALVLVSDTGYVTARQAGLRADEEPALARAIERLAGSGRLAGRTARDFKLEESATGALTTFADLPHREYTLLLSVRSDCESCVDELRLLGVVRQRHPDRLALVSIDHDGPAPDPAPLRLEAAACDMSLRDPEGLFAGRYALGGVPSLLVVDRTGTVVMARQGFLPDEAGSLAAELEGLLGRPILAEPPERRFSEFLRVRGEALELLDEGRAGLAALFLERALELFPDFYTVQVPLAQAYIAAGKIREAAQAFARYLAAEPNACDRGAVLAQLRTISDAP